MSISDDTMRRFSATADYQTLRLYKNTKENSQGDYWVWTENNFACKFSDRRSIAANTMSIQTITWADLPTLTVINPTTRHFTDRDNHRRRWAQQCEPLSVALQQTLLGLVAERRQRLLAIVKRSQACPAHNSSLFYARRRSVSAVHAEMQFIQLMGF